MDLSVLFEPEVLLTAGGVFIVVLVGGIIAMSYIDDPERSDRSDRKRR